MNNNNKAARRADQFADQNAIVEKAEEFPGKVVTCKIPVVTESNSGNDGGQALLAEIKAILDQRLPAKSTGRG